MHEVGGAGAGIVGLCHRVLHEPHGRLLQMAERGVERRDVRFHRRVVLAGVEERLHIGEVRLQRAAAVLRQFAADEIERLDAVGALIDHRDARVAHELLHAPFGDVAVAAEHLLRGDGVGEAEIGEHAFHHRREQAHGVIGGLAFLFVGRAMRDVALQGGPQGERAAGLVDRLDRHQRAPHVRVHDDRVGGLVGIFRTRERAALQALLRVSRGILIGDLRHREPLHADAEPRFVHHDEHRGQAAVLFADQEPGGVVVIHHAGGIAVDAHLVLDRAAGDAVARAERAVGIDEDLRHDEERDALGAFRRAFDARQHEMHDVLGKVLLAAGNENLGTGDLVGAVRLLRRLGAQKAKVRAAMRLGEVHRAGPHAFDHFRQIGFLLRLRAVAQDRGDRALHEAGIHREGEIGGGEKFVDRDGERRRQALAAKFRRRRHADPAALDQVRISLAETLRRRDAAVGVARAALDVAAPIERGQHFGGELAGLGQNRLKGVGRGIGKARQVVVPADLEHVVEEEQHLLDWRFVTWHVLVPRIRSPAHPRSVLKIVQVG